MLPYSDYDLTLKMLDFTVFLDTEKERGLIKSNDNETNIFLKDTDYRVFVNCMFDALKKSDKNERSQMLVTLVKLYIASE